jgi:hypothetical protein
VKFGKRQNAQKGRVPNIVYGYDKIKGDYFNLEINADEAAVVRRIFDSYVNEGHGAAKIAGLLNGEGIRTKRGAAWSQNAVSRILKNELYAGKIINGKEEVADFLTGARRARDEADWFVVERPELRIIEPEIFTKAQEILAARNKAFSNGRERHSNKHLFSTLIKCADCGHSFRRTVHTYKNTYIRWVCGGRNLKGMLSCANRSSVDEGELIGGLREYFAGILAQKPTPVRQIAREFLHSVKAKCGNEAELRGELAQLQKIRQKYMEMYSDDLISREELRKKMGGINAAVIKAENELKLMERGSDASDCPQAIIAMEILTNAQLKQIVQKIVVSAAGDCDVYLHRLNETTQVSDNFT